MPCWMIYTTTVELKAVNRELLERGLTEMGLRFETYGETLFIYTSRGTIELRGSQALIPDLPGMKEQVDAVKRAYSEQVLKEAAKKFRWGLRQKAAGKYTLRKGH